MRSSDVAEVQTAEVPTGHAELGQAHNTSAGALAAELPRARERSPRLANVERLRLLAMFEIVAFHVGGAMSDAEERLPIIAGLGLPTFLLLNNAFNCTLSERLGTKAFLQLKVTRLLLPWLIWSGVYASVVLLEKLRHDEPLSEAFSAWMIIGGTYTHLWFVPFALFGSLLIAWLQTRTQKVPHHLMALVMLVVGSVVVVVDALLLRAWQLDWPALQWLFALPSPLLGFALGRVVLANSRKLMRSAVWVLAAVAVVCVGLALLSLAPEMVRRYAVSMALVSAAFLWPGRMDRFSLRVAPLLFGIYLTHPLVVRVYQASHLPMPPLPLLALLTFAVSAGVVEVMRRGPLRRLV